MTMFGTHPSYGVTGDGLPKGRALPVIRDLTLAYALSLLVAVLTAVLSVAGLVLSSRGLYGVDTKSASPLDPVARRVWVADLALGAPATLIGGVLLWWRAALGSVIGAGLLFSFGVTPVELAAISCRWRRGSPAARRRRSSPMLAWMTSSPAPTTATPPARPSTAWLRRY